MSEDEWRHLLADHGRADENIVEHNELHFALEALLLFGIVEAHQLIFTHLGTEIRERQSNVK